jgi:proteasome lid subunit RPN8/RPN11
MVAHCQMDDPLECCGILGGVTPEVSLFYPLGNALASTDRYDADASDLIRAVQDLRLREAEMVAIYHSHPRWEAVPSRTDLALNFYGPLPRIIVSLLTDPPVVRAWRLGSETFTELPWRLAR